MRTLFTVLLIIGLSCTAKQDEGSSGQPASRTTITVASWNLKNFGPTKLKDPARIDVIVDILKGYDIIAIQEIQNADQTLAPILIGKMNADGDNYNYFISVRVGNTRREQYLIVYNDNVINLIAGTEGYGLEINNEFSREPFYAMFRAGNFDFYLMTIHTDPDEVDVEVPALDTVYVHLQMLTPGEDDIILLGDFNARAPGTTAGSYATMDDLAGIPNMHFAISEETNTRGGRAYDNILFQGNHTSEYTGDAGVYTFWTSYGLTEDEGFAISDHKLVWAKFVTSESDDD